MKGSSDSVTCVDHSKISKYVSRIAERPARTQSSHDGEHQQHPLAAFYTAEGKRTQTRDHFHSLSFSLRSNFNPAKFSLGKPGRICRACKTGTHMTNCSVQGFPQGILTIPDWSCNIGSYTIDRLETLSCSKGLVIFDCALEIKSVQVRIKVRIVAIEKTS